MKQILFFLISLNYFSNLAQGQLNYEIVDGNLFNGKKFIKKNFFVVEGKITFYRPQKIDTVISLKGRYILPPFAEAHNHNLENSYQIDSVVNRYLSDGVFYVKMQSSIKKRIDLISHHFNKPGGPDVSYAHAPLTGSGGYPIKIRETFFDLGRFRGVFNSKSEIEGHGYFVIDSENDLEYKWPRILNASPDFIKINLLYSEEYEKRRNDSNYFGQTGLNPKLIPQIVQKAHRAGLRVSSHVESAYDFHVAVSAGVDEINHLPCIEKVEQLNNSDIKMARKKGTVLVTTVSLVNKYKSNSNYDSLLTNIKQNLTALKKKKIQIAIGSDIFTDDSKKEAVFLKELGVFSNLELLKMWCEAGPGTIFPNRKIGFLKEKFEASFIVLDKNPLEDFSAINSISLRMKQGILLGSNYSK